MDHFERLEALADAFSSSLAMPAYSDHDAVARLQRLRLPSRIASPSRSAEAPVNRGGAAQRRQAQSRLSELAAEDVEAVTVPPLNATGSPQPRPADQK